LFAGAPHSGLSDGHIVNGISGLASIAQNSVCVLRALLPLTARGRGLAAGGAGLALLWTLAVAPLPAAAQQDDDWGAGGPGGGPVWDRRGGSRTPAPLAWLRRSRDSFQDVMHKLARRSAGLHPPLRPDLPPPDPERPDPDWPSAAPGGQERSRPEPDAPWPVEPPTAKVERRRTVESDRDRPRTRVRDWHKSWSHSCRRAGRAVEGAGWYVVAPGDTLQGIAWLHYGDEGAWRRILQVNGGTISDPDLIYACQRLFIPRWRRDRPPLPPCDDPEPPRPACHHPRCDEPRPWPPRPACQRPPPRPDQGDRVGPGGGPAGCTRCGAGAHVGAWGWR